METSVAQMLVLRMSFHLVEKLRDSCKRTAVAESISDLSGAFIYIHGPWAAVDILGQHFTFVSILQFLIMKLES